MKSIKSKIIVALAVILIAGVAYMLGAGVVTLTPRVASATPVLYSQDTVTGIYDSASPAVVEIKVTQQGSLNSRFNQGLGSGFLVDSQGYILTNNHVIDGAASIQVVLNSGNAVDAKVVGTDPVDDLALISVDPSFVSGVTPLQLGDSRAVKPGQMAIALGSPYGLTDSITIGVISGLNRSLGSVRGMLQTDASINPGNSGGPLLDYQGNVIGINTAIESAAGARGIGFAVPSNVATNALPSLITGKPITRPWLGISGMVLTPLQARSLGISVDQGVYVVAVVPNSPADTAGLKGSGTNASGAQAPGGDVITAVDSRPVTSVEDLSTYLNSKQVGDTVVLSLLRNGQSLNIQVTLGARPSTISSQATPQPVPNPSVPWPWGGRIPRGNPTPRA